MSTYQRGDASAGTELCNHPHGLVDRQRFNDQIDVLGFALAQDLQGVDLFEKLAVGVCIPRIDRVTLVNVDDLDGHDRCRLHVFPSVVST